MTPKAAFDNIVERAERLVTLHTELAGGLALAIWGSPEDKT